jgi:sortase A
MTARRLNSASRWIGTVLLCAGALLVGVWAGSLISTKIWQAWQSRAFDRSRSAPAASHPVQVHVGDGDILGRLSIPRLHVEAMIREGTSAPTLTVALGHIPGTSLPGQSGNIGVAGHRDSLFRGLRNVKNNDEILFETANVTYRYRVKATQIVKPEDVGVLNPGPSPELTLVTCYPFEYIGSAPERFIVKADLVNGAPANNVIRPEPPTLVQHREIASPTEHQVSFEVAKGHSRELIPGKIWFGLDSADPSSDTVTGWLWVMPEKRTIWLRHTEKREPIFFEQDGRTRELLITGVTNGSAKGYMVVPPDRG